MVTSLKIKKKELSDLEALLARAGLIDPERRQAFPSRLLVSPRTAKQMQSALRRAFRKDYPLASSQKLEASLAMHWLNLGPNEQRGIADGWAIVVSE